MQELPARRTMATGTPVPPPRLAGAIQPQGALLVCDPPALAIRFHSRNLAKVTAFPGDPFPGMPVSELLGRQVLHDLRNAAAAAGRGGAGVLAGVRLPWSDALFDLRLQSGTGTVLIELEPSAGGAARALDLAQQLMRRLAAADPAQLPETGARLVQALLGFDRVLVCRLLPGGGARVVAEARPPGQDSLTGQDLPAGEVPDLSGPLRAVPDTALAPVPLDPPLAPGMAPADLSQAYLVADGAWADLPGVRAALAIPLAEGAEPRGMLLCRHAQPRAVPPALRSAAELFARCLALRLALIERDEAARRQALVAGELDHRLKNLLSLVQSIARQTAAGAHGAGDYAARLEGRLQALARAHDRPPGGSGGPLAALVAAEAAPHRPGRVTVAGPGVDLGSRAHGAMALVIHEMMTNAAKYGALSVPQGRLAVRWTRDATGGLAIDWCESGGPAVAPPRRSGFGSRLVRTLVEHDLGGTAEIAFLPAGLRARFTLPPRHAVREGGPVPGSACPPAGGGGAP